MSHRLEKHYSDFGGLDTRSNLLTQNPKSARLGSKNFRWNYKDQLQNREGFQPKTGAGSAAEMGLIEYKFRDINTGASRTEVLGVAADGKLRKRSIRRLKLTRTTLSSVSYYSLFYDAAAVTHKIVFYSSTDVVLGSYNVDTSDTLNALETAINALALTGLTASIVDEEGNATSSSLGAVLLDVTYKAYFLTSATNSLYNEAWGWTLIPSPDGNAVFVNAVAYAGKSAPFNDTEVYNSYEGVSYVNENNAVYISDGGFPFKYDGFHVYRAGMPKNIGAAFSGTNVTYVAGTAGPGTSTTGERWVSYQYCFKDSNGVTVFGKINGQGSAPFFYDLSSYEQIAINILDASKSATFDIKRIAKEDQFPIYSCSPSSTQTFSGTGSKVINVNSGHNIVVGMILRLTTRSVTIAGTVYYAEVTAVGASTVTVACPAALPGEFNSVGLLEDVCLNGFYGPDSILGLAQSVYPGNSFFSQDIWGPYIRISSTTASGGMDGNRYFWSIAGIPHDSAHEYSIATSINDSVLTVEIDEFGEDLPRACKYIGKWQGQIVQAGRPYDTTVSEDYYPSLYSSSPTVATEWAKLNFYYSEVHLCDFQSAYWADPENPEGFPQSGANEESFENKFNDQVVGLSENKEALFVFKERTTAYLTGTLATGDIVKEFLEADVGAACHNSIQEVRGSVVFMDQNLGFWSVVAGRLPEFIGYPIQDYFKKNGVQPNISQLNFKKAKSANFRAQDQYVCYVPSGLETDPGSSSLMFVFDYADVPGGKIRGAWYVWQGINAAGGVLATANDELIISQQETGENKLWKQKFTGSIYDFSDYMTAIEFNYKAAFSTANNPVVDKSWIRCVINSVLGGFALRVDQYANFIDTLVGSMTITFASSGRKSSKMEVKANSDKLSGLSWGFYHNTIHQAVTIDGWEVELAESYDQGEAKQ